MNLICVLRDTQLRGSLLVEEASYGMVKNFCFTRSQRLPPFQQGHTLKTVSSSLQVLGESQFDSCYQLAEIDRLQHEVDRSILHRAHDRNWVAVGCDKDDWRITAA